MSEDIESRVPKVNPSQPPSDRTDDTSLIYMKHNIQQAMYVQIYSLHIYVQLMYVRMYNSDLCAFIQIYVHLYSYHILFHCFYYVHSIQNSLAVGLLPITLLTVMLLSDHVS